MNTTIEEKLAYIERFGKELEKIELVPRRVSIGSIKSEIRYVTSVVRYSGENFMGEGSLPAFVLAYDPTVLMLLINLGFKIPITMLNEYTLYFVLDGGLAISNIPRARR